MKLLFTFLILSYISYGQRLLPYDYKLDSIVESNLAMGFNHPSTKEILTLMDRNLVKVTIKTQVNGGGVQNMLSDLSEDYLAMGRYDIRAKFYVSDNLRILFRVANTSLVTKGSGLSYLSGIIIKF